MRGTAPGAESGRSRGAHLDVAAGGCVHSAARGRWPRLSPSQSGQSLWGQESCPGVLSPVGSRRACSIVLPTPPPRSWLSTSVLRACFLPQVFMNRLSVLGTLCVLSVQ